MSSNIQVQRICQHCGKKFTARTTVTQFCSDACAKRAYKVKIRLEKVEVSNRETQRIRNKPIEDLKARDFLTITEACELLSLSRWTIWRAIKNGELKAGKIGRRTLIRRMDLENLFEPFTDKKANKNEGVQSGSDINISKTKDFDIVESYTLTEVQEKYRISETALQNLIRRNNIPKIKKGWYAYVPKKIIDNLLT